LETEQTRNKKKRTEPIPVLFPNHRFGNIIDTSKLVSNLETEVLIIWKKNYIKNFEIKTRKNKKKIIQ
jgi:hypothetical protein